MVTTSARAQRLDMVQSTQALLVSAHVHACMHMYIPMSSTPFSSTYVCRPAPSSTDTSVSSFRSAWVACKKDLEEAVMLSQVGVSFQSSYREARKQRMLCRTFLVAALNVSGVVLAPSLHACEVGDSAEATVIAM